MPDTLAPDSVPAKGLAARILGVVFSPTSTYAGVAARPHWLGVLAFVIVVGGAAQAAFLSTEVGQNALLDQQVKTLESFGRQLNDAQYAQLQRQAKFGAAFAAVGQTVFVTAAALIISGLVFAVFNAILGGDASFKQLFSIVAHSGVILAVQQLFVLPLDYARQSLSSPSTLLALLPFLDDASFIGRLFGAVDLFHIWWIVSLALGIGVLYRRKTGPIASTLLGVYVVIALVIAGVKTALAGA